MIQNNLFVGTPILLTLLLAGPSGSTAAPPGPDDTPIPPTAPAPAAGPDAPASLPAEAGGDLANTAAASGAPDNAKRDEARHFGDAPDDPGPLATDLSPELKADAVAKAVRKVADWQLARAEPYFNKVWTFAVLYTGFVPASDATAEAKYHDAMMDFGKKSDWALGPKAGNADDHCVGQTYLELYLRHHDPAMLAPTRAQFDRLVAVPDDPGKRLPWWWCDALYMAPPVWARLAKATGERKYLDYMNRQWWRTSDALYDKSEHLYSRDANFLTKREKNGKKLFWARGDGWVVGGLARVLQVMPADYPDRGKYVEQLKEMAARVASLQGSDGLWRAGLLDPDAYDLPEVSGSALFLYGLAWGINEGVLDRATYLPVVAKGWAGLLSHVYADGRLGCIQQTGAAPARFKPGSSYVYGVGAFLLAGSEVHRLAKGAG